MSPSSTDHTAVLVFLAATGGVAAGWIISMAFRAGMLLWVYRIERTLQHIYKRLHFMTTQNDKFTSDLADLGSAVADLGTAIDTEAANFQAQIDALKAGAGTAPTPEQLASLEASVASLKTISAKAKQAGLPATPAPAPVAGANDPQASAPASA